MTSKLKCPVCGKDLIPMTLSSNDNCTLYSSVAFPIKDCICNTSASKKIWQALIQAKQDLEFFKEEQDRSATALIERTKELDKCQKDLEESQQATLENAQTILEIHKDLEQSEKCCSAWETKALDYKAETIALSGKLEIARKALITTYARGFTKSEAVGILQRNNMTISKALEQIEHKE